ncbi:MAG: L-aspartate oxidase [Clostridiaceae bacterium]|jgi:L-aspartate oxidase|nr:L-aspartate oxidase [Clostridiaceae bacterium]
MKYSKYSTIIVGSGIAGLYAALKINQQVKLPDGLLLITKSKLGESNSRYAQGGMVAVLKENKDDSTLSHITDTIKAGAGLSELNTVKYISENSDAVVRDLLKFGVEFDRDENNKLVFTMEAAHSVKRILHSGGDATGKMIEQALCKAVREHESIEISEKSMVVDVLVNSKGQCNGVVVYHEETQEYETIYTSAVVLATGGIGQLYKYTTNPIGATADGIALGYRAGAVMQDMEFVQFHPTALAFDDGENRFLISEAVRGEGAKLVDADGIEFMAKYDPKKELAPRDIVTRANYNEMLKNNVDNVYLNATLIDKKKLAKRFPNISKTCLEHGIDITKDFIPVAPAAHYYMGGIKTNVQGETSIKGLYAIGETSSTGLHGGNRLASNSILECVVCAYSVANYLKSMDLKTPDKIDENIKSEIEVYENDDEILEELDVNSLKSKLQDIMWNYVGILRNEEDLMTALEKIHSLESEFPRNKKCLNREEYEFLNMLTVSNLIASTALRRKESRGAHYRSDYPEKNTRCVHSCITNKDGEICFVK